MAEDKKKCDCSFQELLERYSISPDATVREAMKRINDLSGESMTLFAVDAEGVSKGSVTDGDIRRALIAGGELDDKVSKVMNPGFLYACSNDDLAEKMAQGRKRHIELLPIIDEGKIIDFINLKHTVACLPLEAVMMAGGRGERLRPLTDELPKPLLPVAGKPIIEYNLEELESNGIKKIYVTVNYLKEKLKAYFNDRYGRARTECVEEPKRLGTFGSLAYIEGIQSKDIIVMNSDLLTAVDFEAMYRAHKKNGNDFTIGSVPYSVSVPFAIMKLKGDKVQALEEKPTYNYFANGGVYIMRSGLIGKITKGEYLDAPDFITQLIKEGFKVGTFHIQGTWIDIGSPDDYRLANELMSRRI